MSYHGRGVKVSETAPRTGMGWSLTYGGDISRQIRGKADDGAGQATYFSNASDFMNVPINSSIRNAVFATTTLVRDYDFYPDQFTFSGGGTSGKFVFDYETLQPVIQSFGDVKVIPEREVVRGIQKRIIAFKVIDASGNTFYYGVSKDRQRIARDIQYSSIGTSYYLGNAVNDGSSGATQNFSSWKLMDIETPYGELISYHYKNERIIRYEKSHDKHDTGGSNTGLGDINDILKISSKVNRIDEDTWQLEKIVYNQGSVVFTKETSKRQDYEGYALDKITVYDQNNRKIKAYDLNYTYTTSNDYSNVLSHITNLDLFGKSLKRMFLTSIEEEGNTGAKLPPYEFTYNATVLPSRFSTRQDYWGYYNGAENNGPFLRLFEYGTYKPNRRVHLENSKAGILEQIKYPTGGITKFTYEHNRGLKPPFYNHVRIPIISPESKSVVIELTKEDFNYNATTGYQTLNYTFPSNSTVRYKLECFHLRDINGNPNIPDCLFRVLRNGFEMEIGSEKEFSTCPDNSVSFTVTVPRVEGVDPDLHLGRDYNFKLTISYDENSPLLYSSGKRIQKIEYITENDTRVKEFDYTANGSDAGIVIGLPSYLNVDQNNPGQCNNNLIAYFDQTSAYSSYQANSIGYSYVTEYNGTKDNNEGKTEYTFTNMSDGGGDYFNFPYHPPTDNEWLRGKNVYTRVYSNAPTRGYILEKEVFNKYRYGNNLYVDNFDNLNNTGTTIISIDEDFFPPAEYLSWYEEKTSLGKLNNRTIFKLPLFMKTRQTNHLDVSTGGLRIYYLTGGAVNLDHSIERNYFNGKVLENRTNYFYDYNNHYQLKSTEMTDSRGDVYKTENDYDSSLMAQNRMQPVTTTSYKDGVKLSTQHTVYTNTNGILLPEKIQTSKGAQSLEDRAIFHEYDSNGNPIEVSKKDGSKIYYVWGYNKTQPIAKIENYASISNSQRVVISNAINASNLDTSEATENNLRTSLTALRNAFPSSQVTSFTYDPLVGVTSITDPRGEVMYYVYDEFNRLKFVKNTEGEILKEHSYNYKN
ncbi:YD repeat-containing protein [Tenacibaculum sp. 190524A05c]